MRQTVLHGYSLAALSAAVVLAAVPAQAASVLDSDGAKIDIGIEAGLGAFSFDSAAFGAAGLQSQKDPDWFEGYVKPSLTGEIGSPSTGTAFAGFSAVASSTWNDGDASGFSSGSPEDVDVDEAYVGWRSGDVLGSLGSDALTIGVGRQAFVVADGFLIADGYMDQGADGTFWMGPRKAFDFSITAQLDSQGFHADLFHLKVNQSYDALRFAGPAVAEADTTATGFNLSYTEDGLGTIGGMYVAVTDADTGAGRGNDLRDGLKTWTLRAKGTPLEALPDLSLAGQYVWQTNDRSDVDADAYYAQASYTLSETPWSPTLSYRYAHFSGDDPNTATAEGFDPLFYGMTGGWGSWFMGEIVGEYMLYNTNENVHMVHLSANPQDNLSIGVIGYRFSLDESVGGASGHFADEVNVYAGWGVTENININAVYAYASPGKGASGQAAFGDEDAQLFQVFAIIGF